MAQSEFEAFDPNGLSGTQLATRLDERDAAHLSSHKGPGRPNAAVAGTVWVDDSGDPVWKVNLFDGSDDIHLLNIDATANKAFPLSSAQNLPVIDGFTGDGTATDFTLTRTPVGHAALIVTVDGVVVPPGDYTLAGDVLTITTAPANAADVQVWDLSNTGLLDHVALTAVSAKIADVSLAAAKMAEIEAAPGAATDAATARDASQAARDAAQGYRDEAEGFRDVAQTAEQNAAAHGIPAGLLSKHVRAQYGILTRPPVVVIDPVTETYFGPDGPEALTDLIDYVRNSGAVYTDSAGLVQTALADVPRVNHHVLKDGIWQRAGLRVDTQATNMFETSEDFSPSNWTKTNITLSSSYATAPDGTNTASRIESTATSAVRLRNGTSNVSAGPATFSAYLKADTCNHVQFVFNSIGPTSFVWFDLSNGTVGTTTGADVSGVIEHVGDGWYRCSATNIIPAIDSGELEIRVVDGDGVSSVSVGDAILVWGAQFEESGTATSYIKTEGTPVARAADVLSMLAADMPATSGGNTFIFEGAIDWLDDSLNLYLLKWSGINGLLENSGSAQGQFASLLLSPGVAKAGSAYQTIQEGVGIPYKVAFRFSGDEVSVVVNGVTVTVQHAHGYSDPGATVAELMNDIAGTLSSARFFDVALPVAALETETTL